MPKKKASPQAEEAAPSSEDFQRYWDDLKEGLRLPRLTDEQLREFVDDFVSNRIFTLHHIRNAERSHMAGMVFLPVALGVFSKFNPDSLKCVGTIYESYSKALPRSINGMPIFMTFKVLHTKDWERAAKAIETEEKRRQSIELPPAEAEG
jgi:hypothetical protein